MGDFIEPPGALGTRRCCVNNEEGFRALEDPCRFWKAPTDIHECPNPFGVLAGWECQYVVGNRVVEIGELVNTRFTKKDCITLVDLEGGGEFARQTTHEEPKEEWGLS